MRGVGFWPKNALWSMCGKLLRAQTIWSREKAPYGISHSWLPDRGLLQQTPIQKKRLWLLFQNRRLGRLHFVRRMKILPQNNVFLFTIVADISLIHREYFLSLFPQNISCFNRLNNFNILTQRKVSPILRSKLWGIWPSRQSPNVHVSMPTWLVASRK